MQTKLEQQSTEEAALDCDISDLDLEYTWDAPEADSESDFKHALSTYPSYCSTQSDDSDSPEHAWGSDDHSDSASSYSEESDASTASDESNSSWHTDESSSSSDISGTEEASDTSDTDEYDDDVLLWDLQPQCTCQCAVHAPEMRAMV